MLNKKLKRFWVQSQGRRRRRVDPMLLAQELTNLLVHVTQEVHIRGPTIVALILHQEVLENQLQLVFLFHHHELKDNKFNSLILRLKKM